MLSFVRAGAVVAGIALAGVATSAPAFATGNDDPAGNNGTVKIEESVLPDDAPDTTPENNPHQNCSFDIEWYGFDEGPEVISKVSIELHAPTLEGELTIDGPLEVTVGGDAASGAGTESGLDARETYTLTSTGIPHPEQGFHAKVTVETPGSIGNDTKSKVFWFGDCSAEESESPTPTPTPTPTEPLESESPSEASESPSESTPASDETTPAADESSSAPVTDSEVPTNIDAGLAGESDSPVPAMWPLLAMLAGAAAAGTALVVVLRRRAAALVHKD